MDWNQEKAMDQGIKVLEIQAKIETTEKIPIKMFHQPLTLILNLKTIICLRHSLNQNLR